MIIRMHIQGVRGLQISGVFDIKRGTALIKDEIGANQSVTVCPH